MQNGKYYFFRRLNDSEVETNRLRDMIISLTDECRLAKQRFDKSNADCNEAQQLVEDQKMYVSEKFGAGSKAQVEPELEDGQTVELAAK